MNLLFILFGGKFIPNFEQGEIMYDPKKKFREYGQIETLTASLCPFILLGSDI